MKTIIATVAVALSLSAPAFADGFDARAHFAAGNDSAAETIVRESSVGNVLQAQIIGAAANESASEQKVFGEAGIAARNETVLQFFALSNDSASERLVGK